MAALKLHGVTKSFGSFTAVRPTTLEIPSGEFFAVLGPSGCGKTTLLRLIAGYEHPDAGTIVLGDTDITPLRPQDRGIGMVFQNYALFPHMTVFENVAFGLRARKIAPAEIAPRVMAALESVRLAAKRGSPVPALSGGEQQRVAVARALVLRPRLLLFDEPLSNLDAALRVQTREEIRLLQRSTGITTVYVTHDQGEAMTLAGRIAVLRQGSVEQSGKPADLYDSPSGPFVAEFLGGATLINAELGADRSLRAGEEIVLRLPEGIPAPPPGQVILAVKPEALSLVTDGRGDFRGNVESSEYTGFTTTFRLLAGGVALKALVVSSKETRGIAPGSGVSLRLDWRHCSLHPGER